MDRFDKIMAILAAVFVVSSVCTILITADPNNWNLTKCDELDDFELSSGVAFCFNMSDSEKTLVKGTIIDMSSKIYRTYYVVNSVSGGTVEYTQSTVQGGNIDTVNLSCPVSEFLAFDESYYTSLPYYKSMDVCDSVAKCPYRSIASVKYTFTYEHLEDDSDDGYTGEYIVYVSKGYVVKSSWESTLRDGDSESNENSYVKINDLYIPEKTVLGSEGAEQISSFVLESGASFTRSVEDITKVGNGEESTVKTSETYRINSVSAGTVTYELDKTLADGSHDISVSTESIDDFWNMNIGNYVDQGYALCSISYVTVTTECGNLLSIHYVLEKSELGTDYQMILDVFNNMPISYSLKAQDFTGGYTVHSWVIASVSA